MTVLWHFPSTKFRLASCSLCAEGTRPREVLLLHVIVVAGMSVSPGVQLRATGFVMIVACGVHVARANERKLRRGPTHVNKLWSWTWLKASVGLEGVARSWEGHQWSGMSGEWRRSVVVFGNGRRRVSIRTELGY